MTGHEQLPRDVSRRILARAAKGEKAVVVVNRNGKPSKVFGIEEYLKMRDLPGKVKPWEHRRAAQAIPDPLGAINAGILLPLTRENIYDE